MIATRTVELVGGPLDGAWVTVDARCTWYEVAELIAIPSPWDDPRNGEVTVRYRVLCYVQDPADPRRWRLQPTPAAAVDSP